MKDKEVKNIQSTCCMPKTFSRSMINASMGLFHIRLKLKIVHPSLVQLLNYSACSFFNVDTDFVIQFPSYMLEGV